MIVMVVENKDEGKRNLHEKTCQESRIKSAAPPQCDVPAIKTGTDHTGFGLGVNESII